MSRRSKFVLSAILCIALLPAAVKADIISPNKIIKNLSLEKYSKMNEKEVGKDLKLLGKKELLNEINSIAASLENTDYTNELIPFVDILFQRKDQFNDLEVIEAIKNNSNSKVAKEIMVDLYIAKNENNPNKEELKNLLKEDISKEIKAKIVANSKFTAKDANLLKKLINEDDGILAFNSLKKLSKTDANAAYQISKTILSNYKTYSVDKVSGAQKAAVQYFRENKVAKNSLKKEFINSTVDIFNTTDNNALKDSSIFALSDLMDKDSVSEIIKNNKVDRELKVFAIDQNFMILNEMLLNNPTEADIQLVVEAMEILPVSDLVKALENDEKSISDSKLKERCDKVIENMKTNGHKGNVKWLDKK